MTHLAAQSLTAVFWGGGGTVIRILLQLCVQIIMARILGPEQYGLFAMGAVVVSFSSFFADAGIAYGLIQKTHVTDDDLRFVTTWQFLIGSGVSCLIFVSSGFIASFFRDNRASDVVSALAVICLLNALTAPSLNMLKRGFDFRRIQIAQLLAYMVGYIVVGIPLALLGWQVWALVVAWLVQSLVILVVLYTFVRHPFQPMFWYKDAAGLARYGMTVLSTNVLNWLMNNVDRVIVGRFFGSQDIGFYTTSYNMLYNPTSSLLGILQPVFFSASSRLTEDKPRIVAAYQSLIACITLFVLPAFVGLAVVSQTCVLALYGDSWRSLGDTLRPLALAMPLFLLWGMTTPLLWTGGDVSREFKSQVPLAVVWIAVAWLAAHLSLVAVAWAVLGLFVCRFAILLRSAMRLLNMGFASIWQAARGGLALCMLCALVLGITDDVLQTWQLAAIWRLWLDVLVGLATMLLALWVIPGLPGRDVLPIIEQVVSHAPESIAGFLRYLLVKSR